MIRRGLWYVLVVLHENGANTGPPLGGPRTDSSGLMATEAPIEEMKFASGSEVTAMKEFSPMVDLLESSFQIVAAEGGSVYGSEYDLRVGGHREFHYRR